MTDVALVALGSNLGDRDAYLAAARNALSLVPGVRLLAATAVEETSPLGGSCQGPYRNQMLALETSLTPSGLLDCLQLIERRLGRVRAARWGSRTIDLDIVRFGDVTCVTDTLTLPHSGLADRDFWQREVAALDRLVAATA
ncbi:MAG: 2-amino-4-hydroxy-6-hydroxymethyldihydropteridine diphosphokinase [bacterium]